MREKRHTERERQREKIFIIVTSKKKEKERARNKKRQNNAHVLKDELITSSMDVIKYPLDNLDVLAG